MPLFKWLKERCKINIYSDRINLEQIIKLQPELIISYNYKYIIKADIIDYMKGNIINLHISLLPWNRGVSPNFWSFIDNTPKGVTIHQISVKVDEGNIIYQKECKFDETKETFESSYRKLNEMVVELFQKHWEDIKNGNYCLMKQMGEGSYHSAKDLQLQIQECPFQWTDCIADYIEKNNQINREE